MKSLIGVGFSEHLITSSLLNSLEKLFFAGIYVNCDTAADLTVSLFQAVIAKSTVK